MRLRIEPDAEEQLDGLSNATRGEAYGISLRTMDHVVPRALKVRNVVSLAFAVTLIAAPVLAEPPPSGVIDLGPITPPAPPPVPRDPEADVTVQQEPLNQQCAQGAVTKWPLQKGDVSVCPWGTGTLHIRNTGSKTAHKVTVKIPYPKEADRNAHLLRSSVKTKCKREGKKNDSDLDCELGDLAPGDDVTLQLAYGQSHGLPLWTAVQAKVATSDHENKTDNNVATFQPLQPAYVPVLVHCDAACQKERCLAHQSNHGASTAALTALIKGPPCEKQPKWFSYIVEGVFAAGAIVTGVGAVALAEFGAIDTVVFNAGQAGAFIR
jgi:hypothetical protein